MEEEGSWDGDPADQQSTTCFCHVSLCRSLANSALSEPRAPPPGTSNRYSSPSRPCSPKPNTPPTHL